MTDADEVAELAGELARDAAPERTGRTAPQDGLGRRRDATVGRAAPAVGGLGRLRRAGRRAQRRRDARRARPPGAARARRAERRVLAPGCPLSGWRGSFHPGPSASERLLAAATPTARLWVWQRKGRYWTPTGSRRRCARPSPTSWCTSRSSAASRRTRSARIRGTSSRSSTRGARGDGRPRRRRHQGHPGLARRADGPGPRAHDDGPQERGDPCVLRLDEADGPHPGQPGGAPGQPEGRAHSFPRSSRSTPRSDSWRSPVWPHRRAARSQLRDWAAVELLYASGLRVGELVSVDVDDVDLASRSVRVLGKGGKERVVPFGVPAGRALRELARRRPTDPRDARVRACSPAGRPWRPLGPAAGPGSGPPVVGARGGRRHRAPRPAAQCRNPPARGRL